MSIDSHWQTHTQTMSKALIDAAGVGGCAPSIHNTQPWRWRVDADTLELYAEPTRQLMPSDPGGRLMVLSCGAALHHARIALAAEGWRVEIDRMPARGRSRLLARMRLSGRAAVTPEAMRLLQFIPVRHTDRRPVSDAPVASADIDAIRAAVEGEHAGLHTLGPDDVLELAGSVELARSVKAFDPRWREEMSYWAGGIRADALGMSEAASRDGTADVPGRNVGPRGRLPVREDRAAVYAILFGTEDTPTAWLHAGEALSSAWLTAIERGLSVVPLSAAVGVENTRAILRRQLGQLGEPFVVLRFGHAEPDQGDVPHTPRPRSAQVVEVIEESR